LYRIVYVGEGIGEKPAFVRFYSSRSHGAVRLHPPSAIATAAAGVTLLATATAAAGVTVLVYVLL
jgi:hypothetical protein